MRLVRKSSALSNVAYCVNNIDLYQKTMDELGNRGKSRASSSIAINSGQDISEVVVLVCVCACVRVFVGFVMRKSNFEVSS